MNTIAGFACSVGVDMGYNNHHHNHGKKHLHKHGEEQYKHQHHHSEGAISVSSSKPNDDCCLNDVARFALLDKSVTDKSLHLQAPVFFIAFTSSVLVQNENRDGKSVSSKFQFVRRSCFFNDMEIRIAIQSFQI
jgi:hypothetical protein